MASVPLPPVNVSMLLNVVVLSVPELSPVTTNVLFPSVTASVSLPPEPPLIVPSNVVTPASSVNESSPLPPVSVSTPVNATVEASVMLPAFAPVMFQSRFASGPTIESLSPSPLIVSLSTPDVPLTETTSSPAPALIVQSPVPVVS